MTLDGILVVMLIIIIISTVTMDYGDSLTPYSVLNIIKENLLLSMCQVGKGKSEIWLENLIKLTS